MKLAKSIMTGLQTGGGFGVLAVMMAWSPHHYAELIFLRNLGIGFAIAGMAGSLGLCFMGEKKRALVGGLLLLLGVLVAVGLAPAPIQ